MARTIQDIQQIIIDAKNKDANLAALNSTSKTAIWSLWTYVTAVAIWSLENLFDIFKAEVNDTVNRLKPHTLRWYAEKAKNFQFGCNLLQDSDKYDNNALTEEQIQASKIIKHAAVVESNELLRIKVAKEGTDLEPLSLVEKDAFAEYVQRIKDAGVKVTIESREADRLELALSIYYDPLILNGGGQRLDGADLQPVQNTVKAFLKTLPFNGVFVLAYLQDALQQVEGIVIPSITMCQAYYGNVITSIDVQYLPDAGYLRIYNDVDLKILFIPQSQIK